MDCLEGFSCQGHLGRSMCSLPRHQAGPEPRKCPVDVRGSCSGEVGEGREPNQKDIFVLPLLRSRLGFFSQLLPPLGTLPSGGPLRPVLLFCSREKPPTSLPTPPSTASPRPPSLPTRSSAAGGGTVGGDFIFLGSKITADGDCSHEMKRLLFLGRKL